MTQQAGWRIWADRGGTFTDLVARCPDGRVVTHKLLSENPEQYSDAVAQGVRTLLGLATDAPLPKGAVEELRIGTTIATNALLERKGEPTLFVTTQGFADSLRIGYQDRPDLFACHIVLPKMLYSSVLEAQERVSVEGRVLHPLDEESLLRGLERAYRDGCRAVAICLLHGWKHTDHEQRIAALAAKVGFSQISCSHEVSPLIKFVSRGDTTVVDAYLSPILLRYLEGLRESLGIGNGEDFPRVFFMQSNGGLVAAEAFRGKDAILSGPAGGVVGMVATGQKAGFDSLIGFDMGGTSTDVTHWHNSFERSFETKVSGVRMRVPMLKIETVAAGGGSVLRFDGARFRVGPESAGADPGPACYRRGGPLAVTDCNVALGRIQAHRFPAVFGRGGDQPLDTEASRQSFATLAKEISSTQGAEITPEEVAEGFLRIAIENMANAIKKISVQRGHDVTRYTLNAFGGAGGQHACRVADALGIESILLHPYAGVLSAWGIGQAVLRRLLERQVSKPLNADTLKACAAIFAELEATARAELTAQGADAQTIVMAQRLLLRSAGSDTTLEVPYGLEGEVWAGFIKAHRERFGFEMADKGVVIEALSLEASAEGEARPKAETSPTQQTQATQPTQQTQGIQATQGGTSPTGGIQPTQGAHSSHRGHTGHTGGIQGAQATQATQATQAQEAKSPAPDERVRAYFDGWREVPLYLRESLSTGATIEGPAIVAEPASTTVIEPEWRGVLTDNGDLHLTRTVPRPRGEQIGTKADPVMLEIFNNLFMSIAEQMGATLANTAWSVNIKERLDFSCAVFDPQGRLVANAPHMPVHLGSMGESVREILDANPNGIRHGRAWMLNAPYAGGTHLPDVTVVTPVFDEAGRELLFMVASRGHHADIGGRTPGSAPPDSRHIDEEGVVIDNFLLMEDGHLREPEIHQLLTSGKWPCRNPRQNMADINAQIAACETGAAELRRMVGYFGLDTVRAYMRHVQDNAEESVRRALVHLKDGSFIYPLDHGAEIRVSITTDRDKREATVDFTGTSPQDEGNYNAPYPVCRAAVLYVFRTLVQDAIPLNEGCLKPIKILVPPRTMLSPRYPAAVIAGNTEVSQAVTDALYGALGVLAGSQGTMNNFVYGNDALQNYETVCGGTGAGATHDGASAVHSHMTNTRMTDPEVLEQRFPVRIESFSIRRGSGGAGQHSGGDGVIRRVRFNQPMKVTTLSSHREHPPHGLAGGKNGATGRNAVERNSKQGVAPTIEELSGNAEADLDAGDVFIMETPGGGGYGKP